MNLQLAIVADDLTGALDTSAPFALVGFDVAVAVNPESIGQALASGAEVVAVNTASRALAPEIASDIVARAGANLMAANPSIIMKKVDSRLKGNVGAETAALAEACGRGRLLIAPAVPDQGRVTRDGEVHGIGVAAPIGIAKIFADAPQLLAVADAASDADLDNIVASADWRGSLAVGARGLGLALARQIGTDRAGHMVDFAQDEVALFAFGSRDPITDRQIARLAADGVDTVDAHFGAVPDLETRLPVCLRCTGEIRGDGVLVAQRFASGIAKQVARTTPSILVMGGGDTAYAILEALGVTVVIPKGEAAPGLPWFEVKTSQGKQMCCVVKSGGFGSETVLADMLPSQATKQAQIR